MIADVLTYVTRQKLPSVHPVREYLEDLRWDGEARVRMLLPRYAGTDDTELAQSAVYALRSWPVWRAPCSPDVRAIVYWC